MASYTHVESFSDCLLIFNIFMWVFFLLEMISNFTLNVPENLIFIKLSVCIMNKKINAIDIPPFQTIMEMVAHAYACRFISLVTEIIFSFVYLWREYV